MAIGLVKVAAVAIAIAALSFGALLLNRQDTLTEDVTAATLMPPTEATIESAPPVGQPSFEVTPEPSPAEPDTPTIEPSTSTTTPSNQVIDLEFTQQVSETRQKGTLFSTESHRYRFDGALGQSVKVDFVGIVGDGDVRFRIVNPGSAPLAVGRAKGITVPLPETGDYVVAVSSQNQLGAEYEIVISLLDS